MSIQLASKNEIVLLIIWQTVRFATISIGWRTLSDLHIYTSKQRKK